MGSIKKNGTIVILTVIIFGALIFHSLFSSTQSKHRPTFFRRKHEILIEPGSGDINDTMRLRAATLSKKCEQLQTPGEDFFSMSKSALNHLIVDDKYTVMYCYVPKVACTNLKRVFLLLTGKMNGTNPLKLRAEDVHSTYDKYFKYLNTFSSSGIKYRIQNYKKVIFVREPLERLLSAYRNKFEQREFNVYFKESFGRRIIKKYRKNPSEISIKKGDDVALEEFVKYILDPNTLEKRFNEHWASFYELCLPCHIQYDFIGKYESLDNDVNYLLKALAVDDVIQFPVRGDSYKLQKTEDILESYYRRISPGSLEKLAHLYSQDYSIFNYSVLESLQKLILNRK